MSGAIREGLIIADVLCDERAANRTVIVTVNGHVALTEGQNFAKGMLFTYGQWAEVVKFVEAHMPRAGCEPDDWQPDWSRIDDDINYIAADGNRKVWGYMKRPKMSEIEWSGGGVVSQLDIEVPANLHWAESLRRRPEESAKHVNCHCTSR